MPVMVPPFRWIAHAGAILVIAASFLFSIPWSRTAHAVRVWEVDVLDPADYRLTAEYFWGVQSDPRTYSESREWAEYLTTVPFRQIGTGTAYLLTGWLRLGHAPRTSLEIAQTGRLLIVIEKLLMALGMLVVFRSVLEAFGLSTAFAVLLALAFPTRMWRLAEDMLTEPLLRIVLLFLFAAVIPARRRHWPWRGIGIIALLAIAVHIKVQWLVALVLLLPAVIIADDVVVFSPAGATIIALALAIPISIMAVNWIGWGTTALAPGAGIHTHIKYGDDTLRAFCARAAAPPRFCDTSGPRLKWWNVELGGSLRDYEAFDRFAAVDLMRHPARSIEEFIRGLAFASTLPGTEAITDDGLRLVEYGRPWNGVVAIVDRIAWMLIFLGLWIPRTRLIAWTALVMWIVPALGNVVSVYDLRYHQPMAGFALAAAILVAVESRHWIATPITGASRSWASP